MAAKKLVHSSNNTQQGKAKSIVYRSVMCVIFINISCFFFLFCFFLHIFKIYHLLRGHAHDVTLSTTIKKQIMTEILPELKHSAWLGTRYATVVLSLNFID